MLQVVKMILLDLDSSFAAIAKGVNLFKFYLQFEGRTVMISLLTYKHMPKITITV